MTLDLLFLIGTAHIAICGVLHHENRTLSFPLSYPMPLPLPLPSFAG